MEPKLALGTVQFGLPYGITNKNGQPSLNQIVSILKACREYNPFMILDTAASYGDSETILGQAFRAMGDHNFRIITKTDPKNNDIVGCAEKSFDNLGVKSIYGLLDHNASHLLSPHGHDSYARMIALKDAGKISKIGASVYSAAEIDDLLNSFDIDIIQIPLNVFDQRLVRSGHLNKLQERGIEIHARSVFLQGVLLTDVVSLPSAVKPYEEILMGWESACKLAATTKIAAALAYVRNLPQIDAIVIGINTLDEWREIFLAEEIDVDFHFHWDEWASDDIKLLNPALWSG